MILKKWIKDNHLTQSEFADAININKHQLNKILNGRSNASVKLAMRIEDYTDGDISAIDMIFRGRV